MSVIENRNVGAGPLLSCSGVRQCFPKPSAGEIVVLNDVDLTLREGEIVGLLGRSGSGKSTLLRIVAGLMTPTGGKVTYCGGPVAGPWAGVAPGFQTFALFPLVAGLGERGAGMEAPRRPVPRVRLPAAAAIHTNRVCGLPHAPPP